jgi:type III secretion protein S
VNDVLELTKDALWLVLLLSAPSVLAASAMGLLVAFFQAATQLQEQTLSYTVKFITIVIVLFMTAAMLGGTLYTFANRLFETFPALVRSSQ